MKGLSLFLFVILQIGPILSLSMGHMRQLPAKWQSPMGFMSAPMSRSGISYRQSLQERYGSLQHEEEEYKDSKSRRNVITQDKAIISRNYQGQYQNNYKAEAGESSPSSSSLPTITSIVCKSFFLSALPFFLITTNTNTAGSTISPSSVAVVNAAVSAKAIQTDFSIPVDVTTFNKFLQNVDSIKKDLGVERVRTPDLRNSIRTLDLISLRTAIDETLNTGRGGSASDWIERRKVVDKVFRTVTADVINLEEITNKISRKELEVDFPTSKRVKVMEPMMRKLESDVQRLVASLAEEDANVALGSARARFSLCSNGYLICDNYK